MRFVPNDSKLCGNHHSRCKRRRFTLLDVMVIIVIMGLCVGLAGAVVQPDRRGRVQVEAQRLAQQLAFAAAEARFTGRELAWTASGSGYEFWQKTGASGWTAVQDNDVLRPRVVLPEGMRISDLELESNPVQGDMRVEFAAYGQIPAFAVWLSLKTAHYQVSASPVGEFLVAPVTVNEGSDAVASR